MGGERGEVGGGRGEGRGERGEGKGGIGWLEKMMGSLELSLMSDMPDEMSAIMGLTSWNLREYLQH